MHECDLALKASCFRRISYITARHACMPQGLRIMYGAQPVAAALTLGTLHKNSSFVRLRSPTSKQTNVYRAYRPWDCVPGTVSVSFLVSRNSVRRATRTTVRLERARNQAQDASTGMPSKYVAHCRHQVTYSMPATGYRCLVERIINRCISFSHRIPQRRFLRIPMPHPRICHARYQPNVRASVPRLIQDL